MERAANDISLPYLARTAIERFLLFGTTLQPPENPVGVLAQRAGVFVTLRTFEGELRGCIGTIEPACETVAEEVIQNAISAATRDPRFLPLTRPELEATTYGVDVLARPECVTGPQHLDPAIYGVIIETLDGMRRGLLLPRIEGIETIEQQWRAVHQKAGIAPGTTVRIERFTVTRYGKE